MGLKNIEILKKIVAEKEAASNKPLSTMNVNAIICPTKPTAAGVDITARVNALYQKYIKNLPPF